MDVLQRLRKLVKKNSSVRLLNIYKGLPITYDTNILQIGTAEIQVPGSRNHIACLYYQGEAFLQADDLPYIIRSKVKSLNLAQDYAVLTDFQVSQDNIGRRTQIRVEPEEDLMAVLQFDGSAFEFHALVSDISANGASVVFENYVFPARLVQPGRDLTMTLALPDWEARKNRRAASSVVPRASYLRTHPVERDIAITANGTIVAVRPEADEKRQRVSIRLWFKDLSRMIIVQYIAHRQAEIIKDLRVLAEDLYTRKR